MVGMATETKRGGRPSKGNRRLLGSRVPLGLADDVEQAAERLGMSISDYLADLIASAHGHPPVSSTGPTRGELPASA